MTTSDSLVYDVVVVGGGPGGYYATLRLAQRGLRVACVEREEVGGVCLNWGCIPSKALLTAAERYWTLGGSASMGIRVEGASFDLGEAQRWTRGIVEHHTHGVAGLMRAAGADLYRGTAAFGARDAVMVRSREGGEVGLRATRGIVIATGARPTAPRGFEPVPGLVLTAKEAVRLEKIPRRFGVLGGGVIGVELGTLFQKLGAELTIIEATSRLLPSVEADVARVVTKRLARRGARLLTDALARSHERTELGLSIEVETKAGTQHVEVDQLLVAVGFRPNTEELGLDALGIALDERGHVVTDDSCGTSVSGLYAIGDVAGPPYLAHKAFKEAEVVADVLTGHSTVRDYVALPMAIFSDPEIATSGLSEAEARRTLPGVTVGRFPFAALGKAQALGDAEGFVKVVASEGRLVGFSAVGPHVTELLGEATLALETASTIEDVALTVHPHPTISEAFREAAEVALGQPIHIQASPRRPKTVVPILEAR